MNAETTPLPKDGRPRCAWALGAPELLTYHDAEWGFPVSDDRRLFEKLCLEGFQSGLSWRTILNKRENFRAAFENFDIAALARFGEDQVTALLNNPGIIRHRGKIEAAINNARRTQELIEDRGSLAGFLWSYEPSPDELGEPQTLTTSPSSIALSKALKRRGFRFIGPTTAFAFMQSMGLINDHTPECVTRSEVRDAREHFARPDNHGEARSLR